MLNATASIFLVHCIVIFQIQLFHVVLNSILPSWFVPQPALKLPDPQASIDLKSEINVSCDSSYTGENHLTPTYTIFSKITQNGAEHSLATQSSNVFVSVKARPWLACTESIGGKQSGKCMWSKLNVFVKTPIVHEIWDEETNKVNLTCDHEYDDFFQIDLASFTWYDNRVKVSREANPDLTPVENTMIGHNISQKRSGDFGCSLTFYNIVSNISTEVKTEEKKNKPTIESSSKETVPRGSRVTLRCLWEMSHGERVWWKRNKIHFETTGDRLHIQKFTEAYNGQYTCSIHNDNKEWKESDPVLLETVDPFALCHCPCDNSTKTNNLTEEKVKEIVSNLRGNLTVKKTSLSATIREKSSAPDKRVTSVSAGAVAISLITGCVLLIVIHDAIVAGIWVVAKIKCFSSSSASVAE